MKLQATIIVSYRADSLAEAGDKLDDVLRHARERDDIDVERVELHTPATAGTVTLPRVEAPKPPPRRVPHPLTT